MPEALAEALASTMPSLTLPWIIALAVLALIFPPIILLYIFILLVWVVGNLIGAGMGPAMLSVMGFTGIIPPDPAPHIGS